MIGQMIDNTNMVSIRDLFENLGYNVDWKDGKVIIYKKKEAKMKYYTKGHFEVIETTPEKIKPKLAYGKTMTEISDNTAISGTYFDLKNPSSPDSLWQIMAIDGKPLGGNAHTNSYKGYKRGTMICYKDGQVALQYINNINEIKKPYHWAIGGNALFPAYDLDYENVMPDIKRFTHHAGLVFTKNKKILLVVSKIHMTLNAFRHEIINTFDPISVLNLDGGGSVAMKYDGKVIKDQGRKLNNVIVVE